MGNSRFLIREYSLRVSSAYVGFNVQADAITANPATERVDGAEPSGCWRS